MDWLCIFYLSIVLHLRRDLNVYKHMTELDHPEVTLRGLQDVKNPVIN